MAILIMGAATYSIWVGGDAWEVYGKINRYLSVVQPLWLMLCLLILVILGEKSNVNPNSKYLSLLIGMLFVAPTYGIQVNPIRYQFLVATFGLVVCIGFYVVILKFSRDKYGRLVLFTYTVLVINLIPICVWAYSSGRDPLDSLDRSNYQTAQDMKNLLKPSGSATLLFAGTPGYFGERKFVDLLGKNDRRIANSPPNYEEFVGEWNSSFYPGHNKWDSEYSIGHLQPDMVAQSWGTIASENFYAWGYQMYCLNGADRGYYFKKSSKFVIWKKLHSCERL
jgi:hypothetical protein